MRLPALFIVAGTLLACTSSQGDSQPADDPVATFAERYTDAWCTGEVYCGTEGQPLAERCAKAHTFEVQRQAVAAGRATFDAAAADACVAAVAALTCRDRRGYDPDRNGTIPTALPDCGRVFAGQVAPGAPCHADDECDEGVCVRTGASCDGVCRAKKKPGDSCDWQKEDCGYSALACSGETNTCMLMGGAGEPCQTYDTAVQAMWCRFGLSCESYVCVEVPHAGEALQRCGSEGAACGEGRECWKGICHDYTAEGAPCGPGECADGLVCRGYYLSSFHPPAVSEPGSCQKPADVGEPCLDHEPTGVVHISGCAAGLECAGGRCAVSSSSASTCAPSW